MANNTQKELHWSIACYLQFFGIDRHWIQLSHSNSSVVESEQHGVEDHDKYWRNKVMLKDNNWNRQSDHQRKQIDSLIPKPESRPSCCDDPLYNKNGNNSPKFHEFAISQANMEGQISINGNSCHGLKTSCSNERWFSSIRYSHGTVIPGISKMIFK